MTLYTKTDTPRTNEIARGNHVVPTEWAKELERENAMLREAMHCMFDAVNLSTGYVDEKLWERGLDAWKRLNPK